MLKMFSFFQGHHEAQRTPDFNFQNALDEHVRWKLHFEAALRVEGMGYSESQLMLGGGTDLSSWLQQVTSSNPLVADLRESVVHFNTAAAQALGLAKSGDHASAHKVVASGEYLHESKRIKRLLVELEMQRLHVPPAIEMRREKVAVA
ncbi:MAG: hypothetical protein ACRESS_10030 [Stenotrophobium sp.]